MAISSPEMMLVPGCENCQLPSGGTQPDVALTKVDISETTTSNLPADSVLVANPQILHQVSKSSSKLVDRRGWKGKVDAARFLGVEIAMVTRLYADNQD
jgi:hypothetical protein